MCICKHIEETLKPFLFSFTLCVRCHYQLFQDIVFYTSTKYYFLGQKCNSCANRSLTLLYSRKIGKAGITRKQQRAAF